MILEVNTDYPNIRQYLDWNIPNEHINRSKQIPSIFHQNLKENLYPIWPIITPGFPTQNLNFNMNISTAKIIQETMRDGLWKFNLILNKMEEIKNGRIAPIPFEILWQNWLEGSPFENK
uniref:Polynucleotide adenylyltransferase n=1 Tax=Meloidogyne incognita TaxID=6306 RepID=A0A914NGC0_MELIC